MIKVKSKFIINTAKLKQLDQAAVKSLEQTGEALHTEVVQAQVVPFYNGTTQNEAFSVDRKESNHGKVSLVHSTPYSRRIYFNPEGLKFHRSPWVDTYGDGKKHDGNPNARDHWFEPWLPGGEKADFCVKAFKRFYRRNADLK